MAEEFEPYSRTTPKRHYPLTLPFVLIPSHSTMLICDEVWAKCGHGLSSILPTRLQLFARDKGAGQLTFDRKRHNAFS